MSKGLRILHLDGDVGKVAFSENSALGLWETNSGLWFALSCL